MYQLVSLFSFVFFVLHVAVYGCTMLVCAAYSRMPRTGIIVGTSEGEWKIAINKTADFAVGPAMYGNFCAPGTTQGVCMTRAQLASTRTAASSCIEASVVPMTPLIYPKNPCVIIVFAII